MSTVLNVAILDDYQDAARTLDCFRLTDGWSVSIHRDTLKDSRALAARLADADAIILIRERSVLRADLLQQLPRLRLISQTGGGVGNIDVEACTRLGIAVACARSGTSAYAWAASHASVEFAWALILSSMRRVLQQADSLRQGRWQTEVGVTVRGRVLGILGYGRIGAQVAQIGRAFGMRPLVWGRKESHARAAADGMDRAASQRELFANADVLSLHVGLSDDTRGLVTIEDLSSMKPTALFVNTSRAGLVQPGALLEALRAGRPGHAALDVYEDEPLLDTGHPLLSMENVLCTPHIAFVEKDSYEASFRNAFEQVRQFFAGKPLNIVNEEAIGVRATIAR